MNSRNFYVSFGFSNESFTLNEIRKLEKNPLPTAAVKEDTNFSTEFREGFDIWSSIKTIQ